MHSINKKYLQIWLGNLMEIDNSRETAIDGMGVMI